MANPTLGTFKIPTIDNEPMKSYAVGSQERRALETALTQMKKDLPFEIPCIVNGQQVRS
jgi:1-pyrroline-5-carboxylate dehydrogenase